MAVEAAVKAPIKAREFHFTSKKSKYYHIDDILAEATIADETIAKLERIDIVYRMLCAQLFNYANSGHPGGSLSSGKIVASLVFSTMRYDFSQPEREDNDLIVYSAGHKAMGLYSLWGLRNELIKQGDAALLPSDEKNQLRLEDLLGFRKNPKTPTPLFTKFNSKYLDGHPSPLMPFVKIATGPSGIGMGASVGLGIALADIYRKQAPKVNILEGEGGLTPGRVAEALAIAATASLDNVILHVDWNQSSIDSDAVCFESSKGDYVQWTPVEYLKVQDWNIVYVEDGHDFKQVLAAQEFAYNLETDRPTAIVYRTEKGYTYGRSGKASHGSGYAQFSDAFYEHTQAEFEAEFAKLPRPKGKLDANGIESLFWEHLCVVRNALSKDAKGTELATLASGMIRACKQNLDQANRTQRADLGCVETLYTKFDPAQPPADFVFAAGSQDTLRATIGKVFGYLNKQSGGAIISASADLSNSTNIASSSADFAAGFYDKHGNQGARMISAGGICEDGMSATISGISAVGKHIGIGASYAAFLSPLSHISARVHAISQQCYHERTGKNTDTMIVLNGHAGIKTGEDGPTHADAQSLQLYQGNFPRRRAIALTPLDPNEIWPLVIYSLSLRPAVLAPFITRPKELVIDRSKLASKDISAVTKGIYALHKPAKGQKTKKTIVLQGSGSGAVFVSQVMPVLLQEGFAFNAFYVSSKELFELLPEKERDTIFPNALKQHAMAITDYTLPTISGLIHSDEGLRKSLCPYKNEHYLGSGTWDLVMEEAELTKEHQLKAVREFLA